MAYLFFRTLSQGLQAFVPIAALLVWCHAHAADRLASATKRGLGAALPLSILVAAAFRVSERQSLEEALLAMSAMALTMAAFPIVRPREVNQAPALRGAWFPAVAAAVCLIAVRQLMEVATVLHTAVIELRSQQATLMVGCGLVTAGIVGWLALGIGRHLPRRLRRNALWTCWVLFLAQSTLYAFHESAEAGLLPWSEVLHTATEPYGPDGMYGVHFSDLLIVGPIGVAFVGWFRRDRLHHVPLASRGRFHAGRTPAFIALSLLVMGMQTSDARRTQGSAAARADEIAALSARPHVLFRITAPGADFGRLAVAALDKPSGTPLLSALTCERVSFAAGHGLCLHLDRGVFNKYSAILIDSSLKAGTSIGLQGIPSRTRIAPDGRIGAITVFVLGDGYTSDFSTRTTLVDMTSGDEIGQVEEFSTWRDGQRFRAVDFNFWGVTFARDGNTFYAALRTAGKTHLVKGELAIRRLTVVRDNVECPSMSPDGLALAYKKRVGPSPDSWRIHVLDLQSGAEHIVSSETRFIDDQVEWLDSTHILYGVRRRTTSISDVWVAPIDDNEPARIFIPQAESPIVVR